jgi:hypothetical protein
MLTRVTFRVNPLGKPPMHSAALPSAIEKWVVSSLRSGLQSIVLGKHLISLCLPLVGNLTDAKPGRGESA